VIEYTKSYSSHIVIHRKYDKAQSVFAYWKADDAYTIKKCLDHDYKYWKGLRFIRDKDDYRNTQKKIRKYFPILKALHL